MRLNNIFIYVMESARAMVETGIEKREKLWTMNYVLILFFSLSVFITHYALFTNLPAYIQSLSGSNAIVGMSSSIYIIASLVFRPVFGSLVDKKGRKIVMLIGNIIIISSAVLYYFSKSITAILSIRALNGVGFCALSIVVGALVADSVPKSRLSEGIGYSATTLTISTAVAPALGDMLVKILGFKAMFMFVFFVGATGLVLCFMIKYSDTRKQKEKMRRNLIISIYEKSAVKPSLIYLILALSYASIASFVFSYGDSRGIVNISLFFTIYGFSALVVRIVTGKAINKTGINKIFHLGFASLFLAFVILAFANSLAYVIVAAVFYGIGYGISYPLVNLLIMRVCPEEKRGAAMATLFVALDIGLGVGAFIWGAVSTYYGFTPVYLFCSFIVAIGLLYYYIVINKKGNFV